MASHRISVTVDSASIRVAPESLFMTTKDDVSWSATNGKEFSIEFDGNGPFESRSLSHATASGRNTPRARGAFKYSVISSENSDLRLDPEVVVGDPPTGGP